MIQIQKFESQISMAAAISKFDMMLFVDVVKEAVNGGNVDPLAVYVRAKAIAKAMEMIIGEVEGQAMTEAMRHPGKTFEFDSAQITKKEGAEMPDVSFDATWLELKQAIKDREELLKMAFKNRDKAAIVHPETGEVVPVMPTKPYKPSLSISII